MIAGKQLLQLIVGFVLLTVVFSVIERLWPSQSQQRRLRRGFGTDLIYWFLTPLVTKAISQAAVIVAVVPLLLVMDRPLDGKSIQAGFGPVILLPAWAQVALILLIGDFIGYWVHRGFHGRRLWKFHAVHHSSKDLDWLSSVRLHPVNDIVARLCQAVPFVLLGFSPLSSRPTYPSSPSMRSPCTRTSHGHTAHCAMLWRALPSIAGITRRKTRRWKRTSRDSFRSGTCCLGRSICLLGKNGPPNSGCATIRCPRVFGLNSRTRSSPPDANRVFRPPTSLSGKDFFSYSKIAATRVS